MSGREERSSERPSELRIFMSRMRRTPWRTALRQALRTRGKGDRMLLPERLCGGVYGHLVGDALGVPYEFQAPESIDDVAWRGHGTHGQPAGTWSDDGALMLALLDSLLSAGFDTADQARRALEWRERGVYAAGGEVFDVGIATSAALSRLRAGTPPEEAGSIDAKGNGSLMRILPLALVFRESDAGELVAMATRTSRVTHGSAEAQIGCALYSLIVRRLLSGAADRPRVLEEARDTLRRALAEVGLPGSREAERPEEASRALDAFLAWGERSGGGRVVDSFWSAWDAFAGSADYAATVTAAVGYGHDTDTTAAIAGGLGGVFWGIGGIPSPWHRSLRDRHVPQELADRLVETDDSEWDQTPWKTSRLSPLRVDLVDLSGTDLGERGGTLGLTFLPGKRYVGYYTGHHWRDLDSDAARLRDLGVDVLMLLVEDKELRECRVTEIGDVLPRYGVELVRQPVEDLELPADDHAFAAGLSELVARIRSGTKVAVACRGGLDRTGMVGACVLCEAGLSADEAIGRVQRAREHTLTLPNQQRFVKAWCSTRRALGIKGA